MEKVEKICLNGCVYTATELLYISFCYSRFSIKAFDGLVSRFLVCRMQFSNEAFVYNGDVSVFLRTVYDIKINSIFSIGFVHVNIFMK